MSRTNIDVDDEACAEVMRRYRLATKREAVISRSRRSQPSPSASRRRGGLRGSGWQGDLDELRSSRFR